MKLRHLLPALLLAALPLTTAHAFIDVNISVAPPVLPVYEQPPCPYEGYLWTPGYWGYGDDAYYWVPGVWCAPPRIGFLWTPGFWGFNDGYYAFHTGYWGPTIGFYGGVNYGYGYGGYGYDGGRWDGNHFRYNTYVTNVNKTVIHNTYIDRNVSRSTGAGRASFNGPGGIRARPDARQLAAARGPRVPPTSTQIAHGNSAGRNRQIPASANHGRPSIATTHAPARADGFANHAPRAGRDGLSPEERQLVNRRQAAMTAARSTPRDSGNGRPMRGYGYDGRAPRQSSGDRQPYGNPHQVQKPERHPDNGQKHDDRKHDKHGDEGR